MALEFPPLEEEESLWLVYAAFDTLNFAAIFFSFSAENNLRSRHKHRSLLGYGAVCTLTEPLIVTIKH